MLVRHELHRAQQSGGKRRRAMKFDWTLLSIIIGTAAVSAFWRVYPESQNIAFEFLDRHPSLTVGGLILFLGWSIYLIRHHAKRRN